MANKEQREGLARLFDTLAASAIIGIVVGCAGHTPMSVGEIISLACAFPVLLTFSWLLRKHPK